MLYKQDTIVNKAFRYARKKHENQYYGDRTFMYHPIQVAKIIRLLTPDDKHLIAAAYLHDTIEQTNTSYYDLMMEFNDDIAALVQEVTKTTYNTFPALRTPRGVLLKFADRTANLANINAWSDEEQQQYILKSQFWKTLYLIHNECVQKP